MALIKCTSCGHMVSDRASKCPKCGNLLNASGNSSKHNVDGDPDESKKKILWAIIGVLAVLIIIGFAWLLLGGKNSMTDASDNANTAMTDSLSLGVDVGYAIPDDEYVYEGTWDEGGEHPQPCQIHFTKEGGQLSNCLYKNLKWDTSIPLKGEIKGDSLWFGGKIGQKDLLIVLAPSSDGSKMSGRGCDYAHGHTNRKIVLNRISYEAEAKEVVDSAYSEAVEDPVAEVEEWADVDEYEDAPQESKTVSNSPTRLSNEIRQVAEVMPQFPGGEQAMMRWISANVHYPNEAAEKGEHGRVSVKFIINENGDVEQPTIVRSVSPSLDREAIRLVKQMPRWKPGYQDGYPCKVYYTIPISFSIQ